MKKILFIHHAEGWGGAPNSMIRLINSLDTSKYEAEVLLIKQSVVADKLTESGIKYRVAESNFYKKYYNYFTHSEADYLKWYKIYSFIKLGFLWILSRYYFAKKELLNYEVDIVHLNSSVLTDWLAPSKKKGKVIIHIREPFRKGKLDFLHGIFKHQMRNYADHIIAISKDNAKRVNLPFKTTVVYNYSNVEDLSELNIEKYYSKSVLYVGGLSRIKGYYTLIEALKFIDDDIKIYFAGYYEPLTNLKKLNLNQVIKRLLKSLYYKKETILYDEYMKNTKAVKIGLISDINEYLDKTICLISPFTVPHFSRPIIEAFGRRKPAIATKITGMDEMVDDGKNGILVGEGNAKALAFAINYICDNPEIAKAMGNSGYEIARKKYSQNNIKQIHEVYDKLNCL